MTEKNIENLVINKVESQEVYDAMVTAGKINDDELYLVEGGTEQPVIYLQVKNNKVSMTMAEIRASISSGVPVSLIYNGFIYNYVKDDTSNNQIYFAVPSAPLIGNSTQAEHYYCYLDDDTGKENVSFSEKSDQHLPSIISPGDLSKVPVSVQTGRYDYSYVLQPLPTGLPDVTADDNNKILQVQNGAWNVVSSDAEKNTIVTVKKNGTALTPDTNRAVDIEVPTKTSELENDSNFATKNDLDNKVTTPPIATTSGTGAAYTATIQGITELYKGLTIIIIPNVASTSTAPTLNINGLGAKAIRRPYSSSTSTTYVGNATSWIAASYPILLVYNGSYWVAQGNTKTNLAEGVGTVPVTNGGTGKTTLTANSYLVGNGTSAVTLKAKTAVCADIGAIASDNIVNQKLVSTETTPTTNYYINWIYG